MDLLTIVYSSTRIGEYIEFTYWAGSSCSLYYKVSIFLWLKAVK